MLVEAKKRSELKSRFSMIFLLWRTGPSLVAVCNVKNLESVRSSWGVFHNSWNVEEFIGQMRLFLPLTCHFHWRTFTYHAV